MADDEVVKLLTDIKESLEREMAALREVITTRFDVQATRMDRQAALIQTGSRWTGRMNEWSEHVDVILEDFAKRIAELERRKNGGLEGSGPA